MTFNPAKHHRCSNRLKGFDYTQTGAYFITLCVRDRQCFFGVIKNDRVVLNNRGEFAQSCWIDIPQHFPHVQIDEFVIMPNHIHGIFIFHDFPKPVVGATDPVAHCGLSTIVIPEAIDASPLKNPPDFTPIDTSKGATGSVAPTDGIKNGEPELKKRPNGPPSGSLGAIIGQYKFVVTKHINAMNKTPGKPLWQRDFYDHIGRNTSDLNFIRQYIRKNPVHWDTDSNNQGSSQPKFVAMPNPQRP